MERLTHCLSCALYHRNEEDTCRAFPQGIPQDILDGAPHNSSRYGEPTYTPLPHMKKSMNAFNQRS